MISSLTISVQLLDQFPIYSLFIRTTVDHYVRDKGGGAVLEETKVRLSRSRKSNQYLSLLRNSF